MTLATSPLATGEEPCAPAPAAVRSPTATVLRGALHLLSAQPLTWAASAVAAILVPRYLGEEALGEFAFAFTLAGLVGTVLGLGVSDYLVRRVASTPSALRSEGGAALVLLSGVALVAALLVSAALPLAGVGGTEAALLRLALGGIVLSAMLSVLVTLLRAQEHHGRYAWLTAGAGVAANVAAVGVLLLGGGVTAYAAAIVLSGGLAVAVIWPLSGLRLRRASFAPTLLLQVLRGGLPFLGWSVAVRLRMELDRILLGFLSTSAVVGWYAAAYRIVGVAVFVPTLIATPLLPALSRCRDDRQLFAETLRRSLIATLVLAVPICAAMLAVAPAVPDLFHWPAGFRHSVPLIAILALQMPLVSVDMVIGTGLIALHRERAWLAVAVIGAVFNLLANLCLIGVFDRTAGNGAIGAAVATVTTEVLVMAGALILLPRGILDRRVLLVGARLLAAGAVMAAVIAALLSFSLVVALVAGSAAFAVLVPALGVLSAADIAALPGGEAVLRRLAAARVPGRRSTRTALGGAALIVLVLAAAVLLLSACAGPRREATRPAAEPTRLSGIAALRERLGATPASAQPVTAAAPAVATGALGAAPLPPPPAGWPLTLQLGMMNEPGGVAAMRRIAHFGFRYQYLAGGVNTGNGWATWSPEGRFVDAYIAESRDQGMIPVFTYYMLYQSAPGSGQPEAKGIETNLNNAATMRTYFDDLTLFFRRAAASPGVVVLHVEPDLWGYVQQRARNDNAAAVPVQVAATGNADLVGLPDSAAGLAQAVVRLRDRYAPNVLLGYHVSGWGTGVDIVYTDPNDGAVDALASRSAAFYRSLAADFDVAFAEFSDRDAAFKEAQYRDGGASWWDAGDFRRHVRFIARFTGAAGERVVLWQIPYGNTRMRAMNNTWGHYQDNRVEWLLDDPDLVHLRAYLDAGVIALLFGQGAGGTTCPCDAMGDGVTNPAPINGNTRDSLNADDDGGFFRERAGAYYAGGPLPLPAP